MSEPKHTAAPRKPRPSAAKAKVTAPPSTLLFEGADWDFEMLGRIFDSVRDIGERELGLDTYRTQIEVITSEQMLDAYSSVGMPLFYKHWSFGKDFARNESLYRKGWQGLAYEIVINSDPCICYIMEENSATMQTLVLSHAAMGHNHFFKNNYVFQQWTDATGINDYLSFAKNYLARCEERYGVEAVERRDRRGACAAEPWHPPLSRQAHDGPAYRRAARAGTPRTWRGAVQ